MVRRRSVVLVNRFYWPEFAPTGQLMTDLAEHLAAEGWLVTVITSRSAYAGPSNATPPRERRKGVRIIRLRTTRFGRETLAGRVADYVSFLGGAFLRLLFVKRPDVVVAMTDPPLLLAPCMLAARLRSARCLYWVQDVYPALAVRLGILRERGLPYRLLMPLTSWMHARVDAVVTVGPGVTRSMVAAGAPAERTTHVHNWVDTQSLVPVPRAENGFLTEHGLSGKFVVLYAGNAGRGHTFAAVMEAARRLKARSDVLFLFIGGGQAVADLRRTAEEAALSNVRFLDYVSRDRLPFALSAASVSLVTEDPAVVGLLVPSKTYGILASGRPVVFVGSPASDVAQIVRGARCGFVVPPDSPELLAEVILRLRRDAAEAVRLGRNGRKACIGLYGRTMALDSWREILDELVTRRGCDQRMSQPQRRAPIQAAPEVRAVPESTLRVRASKGR